MEKQIFKAKLLNEISQAEYQCDYSELADYYDRCVVLDKATDKLIEITEHKRNYVAILGNAEAGHISAIQTALEEQFDVAFAVKSDAPKGRDIPKELVTSLELKKVDIVSRAIKVKEHKNKHYKGHERKYKFHK